MEPIDPKHIAAAIEDFNLPLEQRRYKPPRSHMSDVLGYATHEAYDSDGKRIVTTITGDGLNADSEARLKLGAAFASGFVLGLVLMFIFFALMGGAS